MTEASTPDWLNAALPAYEVGTEIGSGRNGSIWRGEHRKLKRPVAIMDLVGFDTDSGASSAALTQYARLLSKIDHPHLVALYDAVQAESHHLLIVELLEGGDAVAWRRDRGLSLIDSIALGLAVLSGLDHLHSAGAIHGDVHPTNILFTREGIPRLAGIDFRRGQRPPTDSSLAGLDSDGPRLACRPPEVIAGQSHSTATDLYSVAASLYFLMSGSWPVDGRAESSGVAGKQVDLEIERGSERYPGTTFVPVSEFAEIPAEIERAIMKGLRFNPAGRWVSANEFGVALATASTDALGPRWLDSSEIRVFPSRAVAESLGVHTATAGPSEYLTRATTRSTRSPELEVIEQGAATSRRVPIHGPLEIGRKGPGIKLADTEASRYHCRVSPGPEGVLLEDLGSTNGTRLNGTLIAARTLMKPGDRIQVGSTVLILR